MSCVVDDGVVDEIGMFAETETVEDEETGGVVVVVVAEVGVEKTILDVDMGAGIGVVGEMGVEVEADVGVGTETGVDEGIEEEDVGAVVVVVDAIVGGGGDMGAVAPGGVTPDDEVVETGVAVAIVPADTTVEEFVVAGRTFSVETFNSPGRKEFKIGTAVDGTGETIV
jgi:hypothetical protein